MPQELRLEQGRVTATAPRVGLPDAIERGVAAVETDLAQAPFAAPTADRLRELATLHREGILSDEEFSSAKAALLSGL